MGKNLDSGIDPRFGRASFLIFLNEKGEVEKAVSNPGVRARRGAGISVAQNIVGEGAEVLIISNIGPNAFGVLKGAGVKLFSAGACSSVGEAFAGWKKGELSELTSATGPSRRGFGPGRGRSRGRF